MSKSSVANGILLVCAMVLMGGCGPKDKGKGPQDSNGTPSNGKGAKVYKIGAVIGKSGALENWGRQSEWGMKLAQEELKGKDGITVELDIRDNKSTPDQSVNEFISLVNVEKVHAVLGAVASSFTRQMKEQANKLKVPLITHASTNVQLTQDTEWLFRICYNDSIQGKVCAKYAMENMKLKKAAIVTDAAQDYSRGLSNNFKETFTKMGGTVVEELTYQSGDKVFTSQVEKLKSLEIDCVFCSGYAAEAALLLKTAREAGFQKPMIGGDGLDDPQFPNIAGALAGTGVFLCDHANAEDPDPKVRKFVEAYKSKHNEMPGAMAFLGYDVVYVIHDCIKRASEKGDVTRESLRDAIASIKDFAMVTGTITMGKDHEVKKRAVIVEYQADKSMKFRAEFKPEELYEK